MCPPFPLPEVLSPALTQTTKSFCSVGKWEGFCTGKGHQISSCPSLGRFPTSSVPQVWGEGPKVGDTSGGQWLARVPTQAAVTEHHQTPPSHPPGSFHHEQAQEGLASEEN